MRTGLAIALLLIAGIAWLASRDTGGSAVAPRVRVSTDAAPAIAADGPSAPDQDRRAVPLSEAADEPATHDAGESVTELRVRVRLPDGSPWSGGTLEVAAPLPAVDLRDGARRGRRTDARVAIFDGETHRVRLETDERGRAVFEPIVPGVAFALRAIDALDAPGAELQVPALASGERRELELAVPAPAALRGQCMDARGRALSGVQVHVESQGWSVTAECDEQGRFETSPLFARALEVRARLDDLAASRLLAVDPTAGPVELVLERERSLLVESVDAAGATVHGLAPTVHADSQGLALDVWITRTTTGWHLRNVPSGPLTLRWGGACTPQSQTLGGEDFEVRVVDSALGELVLEVAPPPRGADVAHYVEVLCPDGSTAAAARKLVTGTIVHELEWDLPPGRYLVQRVAVPRGASQQSQRLGNPLRVNVLAEETTRERLDP